MVRETQGEVIEKCSSIVLPDTIRLGQTCHDWDAALMLIVPHP